MVVVNTGSLSLQVFNSISPLSSNISGLLTTIIDQNRFYVEQFTGTTIGSVIQERYQLPIVNLATAQVLNMMAMQDGGINEVVLGEMRVFSNNIQAIAQDYQKNGQAQLMSLTRGLKLYKARG